MSTTAQSQRPTRSMLSLHYATLPSEAPSSAQRHERPRRRSTTTTHHTFAAFNTPRTQPGKPPSSSQQAPTTFRERHDSYMPTYDPPPFHPTALLLNQYYSTILESIPRTSALTFPPEEMKAQSMAQRRRTVCKRNRENL